ncbi:MAG: hypothetical protein PIR02_15960 [Microbacterium enclense]
MSWDSAFWWPHTVIVEDALPSGGSGTRLGPARELKKAEIKDQQKLIVAADATEQVSNTQVTVPLAAAVPIGSFVTVWKSKPGQRRARVIAVERDENAPPLPSHLILFLQ